MKYKKRPVVIEAKQWLGTEESLEELYEFCGQHITDASLQTKELKIETLEGIHKASCGGYIIQGIQGEFYPCKPDIFHATYELVSLD